MNWLPLCISFFLCNRGPKVTWEVLFRALGKDDVSLKITHCGICYADVVMSKNKYGDSRDHTFDPYMSLLKTAGVFVLVGFPSEVKFSPASLNIGNLL